MSWQPIETAPRDRRILLRISQQAMRGLFPDCELEFVTVGYWCKLLNYNKQLLAEGWGDGCVFLGEAIEWHEIPPFKVVPAAPSPEPSSVGTWVMTWLQRAWLDSDYCFVLDVLDDESPCNTRRTWNDVGWAIMKAMWDELAEAPYASN